MNIKAMMLIGVLSFSLPRVYAQIEHPVKWSYSAKRTGEHEAVILFKADIEKGWHIYSVNQKEGGPVKTSFTFSASPDFQLMGGITEPAPVTRREEVFDMEVSYFERQVIFKQKITLTVPGTQVKGALNFMVCNNQKCLPPETVEFKIPVK